MNNYMVGGEEVNTNKVDQLNSFLMYQHKAFTLEASLYTCTMCLL